MCYTVYMKAILIENKRLIPRTIPDPVPADGEVLIDVRAAALNRADLLQREGNYPPPPLILPTKTFTIRLNITAFAERK